MLFYVSLRHKRGNMITIIEHLENKNNGNTTNQNSWDMA